MRLFLSCHPQLSVIAPVAWSKSTGAKPNKKPAESLSGGIALCSLYHLSKGLWIHLRLVVTLEMPSKDSSYKKVFFTEHMPIERTPKSRALGVIIEILEPAKKNRVDVRDAAMIKFASDLVQKRIMNEGLGTDRKKG